MTLLSLCPLKSHQKHHSLPFLFSRLSRELLSLKTLAFGDGPHADRLQPPRAALRRAAAPQAAPTAAPAAAAVYPGRWRGRPPEEGCRGGGRVRVALRRAARAGEARTWTLQGEPSPTSGTSPERPASFSPKISIVGGSIDRILLHD